MTMIPIILKLKFHDSWWNMHIHQIIFNFRKFTLYAKYIFEFISSFFKMSLSLLLVELLLVLESDRFFRFIFVDEISTRDGWNKDEKGGKNEKKRTSISFRRLSIPMWWNDSREWRTAVRATRGQKFRIPAVFVARYLFRQRIIVVVYYLNFGTFNSPSFHQRGQYERCAFPTRGIFPSVEKLDEGMK